MACPFFRPLRPQPSNGERLPLGELYEGECCASAPVAPNRTEICNRGYARGLCDRFPADAVADAVRFSITSHTCGIVKLIWILEKDHIPVQHGELTYSEKTGAFSSAPENLIAEQARSFIESSLRR